ncbi:MAG: hypothetical protein AAF609_25975 [Cyanobacteria bacterium P01_C01_bin.120]
MEQPPFHNSNRDPLPDANDIEAEFRNTDGYLHMDEQVFQPSAENRARLEADKRWLRNLIIRLLLAGLAIGALLSVGLIWSLNQLDMINPPGLNESIE